MSERSRLAPAEGLARIPSPPPRPAAAEQPPTAAAENAPIPRSGRPAAAVRPATPTKTNGSGELGGIRSVTLSLPLALRAQLRQRASASPNLTVAQVLLGAVERQAAQLAHLVEAERPATLEESSLFPDPAAARRPQSGEDRGPLTVRISAGNLAVLDRLQLETAADNRSQMISAVLRAEFAS